MNSEQYFNTLSHINDFPTLPSTSQKIGKALESPETDVDDIAKIVMQDPTLTAKLIKIANSSFFGFREKVESIQKAITFLGFKLVKELTTTTSVIHSFADKQSELDRQKFWQHSIGVAISAKLIAKDYGVSLNQQDELFTIGLLHDIGKVVTEIYFPSEFQKIKALVKNQNLYFWQSEQKVLGFTHSETGRWLSKFWNFSEKTVSVISYHHALKAGFKFISERERLFLSIINLSDTIIKDAKFGFAWDYKTATVDPLAVEFLDLSSAQVKHYINQLKKELARIDDFVISTL